MPPPDEPFKGVDRRSKRPAEVRLTDETIDYIEAKMRAAVADAIKDVVTEETARRFWGAGLTLLQKQATNHAGRFVLGGLWGLVRKVSFFITVGGIVYAVGGWALLATFFKAVFSSGPP